MLQAITAGSIDIVQLLLQHDYDVLSKLDGQMTALQYATFLDRRDICDALLKYGADPDAKSL